MTIYLGTDIVIGMLQIRKAARLLDMQLFLSGFGLVGLTALTFMTSFIYNLAYVERNADLVVNAVILLFINDLDEKVMSAFSIMLPEWTCKRLTEIKEKMSERKTMSVIEHISRHMINDEPKVERYYDEFSIEKAEEAIENYDVNSRGTKEESIEIALDPQHE